MNGQAIRAKLRALRAEVAELQEKTHQYFKTKPHTVNAMAAHRDREERLRQILDELEGLSQERIRK
jgi:hypothetical protein